METPERIWLIDHGDGISWCDSPNPSDEILESDSIDYVRADKYQALLDLGKEISSKTATYSQSVKDENGNEKMAILLEDVADLLGKLDRLVDTNKDYKSSKLSTDFEMPLRGSGSAKTTIHMRDNDKG